MNGSLSDNLLQGGCMAALDTVHGESIQILSGPDAGKSFWGIREVQQDVVLTGDLMPDPRGRQMVRFTKRPGNCLSPQTPRLVKMKTFDGQVWSATRQDFGAYLSTDFELVEIATGIDS